MSTLIPSAQPKSELPDPWSGAFSTFVRKHSKWVGRFPDNEPVYALPEVVLDVLSHSNGASSRPVMDTAMVAAEREFTRLCESRCIVGVGSQGPIPYHLLTGAPLRIPPDLAASLDWSAAHVRSAELLAEKSTEACRRLRGVVGWLLTEPSFLEQTAEVRRLYDELPSEHRPCFPLGRVVQAPEGFEAHTHGAFANALRRLLDRWGLMSLAAWDLPNPQGPLLPDLLPADAVARPPHGVYVYLPVHYPLQGDDDLQRQIVQFQRQRVMELGIDPSFAGSSHHETYERMFHILHLEGAIRRRFNHPPRGLVQSTEAALAKALRLSPARVRRLRQWIRTCRVGNRSQVKSLRSPS